MLCLHMTAPLSGNTFLCNLACNANGGHLASKVLQQLSPEKPCHSHLFLEDRKLDLQQTVNENGLVDGSEVHYLINQALSNKQPKELHVPSRAEVVSSVVAEPHEDIVLTQGYVTKCGRLRSVLGRLQYQFWVGCNVKQCVAICAGWQRQA